MSKPDFSFIHGYILLSKTLLSVLERLHISVKIVVEFILRHVKFNRTLHPKYLSSKDCLIRSCQKIGTLLLIKPCFKMKEIDAVTKVVVLIEYSNDKTDSKRKSRC